VAYLVANGEEMTPVADLRSWLKQDLPEFMVPSAFVTLKAWPLTPNGKVDRRALPKPDDAARLSRGYQAPFGKIEEDLARIWADLLKLERAGVRDNFFELGGNSLLAVRAVERMTRAVGPGIELIDLFRTPTIAGLAAKLTSPGQDGDDSAIGDELVVLRDGPGTPVVFVGWTPNSQLMSAVNAVSPIWFLPLPGLHRPTSNIVPIPEIAAGYAAAIEATRPFGPITLVAHSFPGLLAYDLMAKLRTAGREVRVVLIEPSAPAGTVQWSRLQRAGRQLQSIGQLDWAGRVGYILSRVRSRLIRSFRRYHLATIRQWVRLRMALTGRLPAKYQVYWFFEPQYQRRAAQYRPPHSAEPFTLAARAEWAVDHLDAWANLNGRVDYIQLADGSTHLDVMTPEVAQPWLKVVNNPWTPSS
jgi:thioesterase domain-containing protein